MNVVSLSVESGRELGSSRSRRLRALGRIPGTVYGMGSDAVSVTVERSELRRALTTEAGVNALIELSFDGTKQYTLVKEIQRHPVRRDPIHLDFQRIDPEVPMTLTIPIVFTGEPKKVTANGGMVETMLQSIRVSVRPDAIPNEFSVDVSGLEIDQSVTVGDLDLPEGVTTDVDPEQAIVVAVLTRAAMVSTHDDDGAGEAPAEAAGDESASSD